MTTLVFVYGTLKKSFPNHYLLEGKDDVEFISDGVTVDKYPMVIDSPYKIPFILNDVGKGANIKGEIYKVGKTALAALDKLEDHPNLYKRTDIKVSTIKDSSIVAEQDSANTVTCGCYILHDFKPSMLENELISTYTLAQSVDYVKPEGRVQAQPVISFVKKAS